jgi:hypothetical protein
MHKTLAVLALAAAAVACSSSNPTAPLPSPTPEPTPVPTAAAPAALSCPLTRMPDHGNCRNDTASLIGHVDVAIDTLIATEPQIFDLHDTAGCDRCPRIVNNAAFERGMVRELLKQGVCAQCDEECGLKTTNEWNEQYKLSNSTGYLLRPEKFYKVTCYPAAF